jgi:integrase
MKATFETPVNLHIDPAPENVVKLAVVPAPPKPKRLVFPPPATPRKERFRISEFRNRSGTVSWCVSGSKANGERVRQNFADPRQAEARKLALEAEHLAAPVGVPLLQATHLSAEQIKIAESAFGQLDNPQDLLAAVHHWRHTGKPHGAVEAPRLDEAAIQFIAWLEETKALREISKPSLRLRVQAFASGMHNVFVNEITTEDIEKFLSECKVSPVTLDNHRRALSRFFSWCNERPRRWCPLNPCAAARVETEEKGAPTILSLDECKRLLRAAEQHKGGMLVPFTAIALFAGLRPFELSRLTWQQVNMADGEIRLDAKQTKVGRPRVVTINPTLKKWLEAYEGKPIFPSGQRKNFDAVKARAGFGGRQSAATTGLKPWTPDILRHTSISHHFRQTGSYGQCAEAFGNSESIIKAHYQGRVTSEETKAFFALRPVKGKAR